MREHAGAVHAVVLGYADRRDADDVVQDVWTRVLRGLTTFDGRARLSTWLFRVATNVGLNHARARRRRPPLPSLPAEDALPSTALDPARALDAEDERDALRRALDELPDEQRAVVVLRVYRGLSFEEVAAALGIARPTAESRMARAKERLRALLVPAREAR